MRARVAGVVALALAASGCCDPDLTVREPAASGGLTDLAPGVGTMVLLFLAPAVAACLVVAWRRSPLDGYGPAWGVVLVGLGIVGVFGAAVLGPVAASVSPGDIARAEHGGPELRGLVTVVVDSGESDPLGEKGRGAWWMAVGGTAVVAAGAALARFGRGAWPLSLVGGVGGGGAAAIGAFLLAGDACARLESPAIVISTFAAGIAGLVALLGTPAALVAEVVSTWRGERRARRGGGDPGVAAA